jgi:hypothetical protein
MTEAEKFHKAQLEKATEVARRDVNALSPTERVKLQADLHEFLLRGGVHMLVDLSKVTAEEIMKTLVPLPYVPEVVEGIRETLEWLVVQDGETVMSDPEKPGTINLSATATATLQLRADSVSSPFRLYFAMQPNKETAKWALLYHLKHSGVTPDRIQLCPRYECKNIFVLGVHADPTRAHYCSPKCSQAAALKVYRSKNKALALMAKGKSNAAIAKDLGTPIETVKKWRKEHGKRKLPKRKGEK